MNIRFKEKQKFTQWWLWLILTGAGAFLLYGLYKQVLLGKPLGDLPASDGGLVFSAALVLFIIILFGFMQLKTEIDAHEIRMQFFPFVKKRVRWSDIKSARTVNYGFVGGWGIRFLTPYGTVFNIKGNKGLAIELKNGKKFLIGTQKEAELRRAIENGGGIFCSPEKLWI